MVPANSTIRSVADLRGKKSRLRAAHSTRAGCCCRAWRAAPISICAGKPASFMAAPPLLSEKAVQGEHDATLTFWNFCADLEGKGFKRAIVVDEVMKQLGAKAAVAILGFTFRSAWAAKNKFAIDRSWSLGQARRSGLDRI